MHFDSRVRINSRGFRGKEFAAEKGDAYRIVALGESTTFGLTFYSDEQPWPEWLEEFILRRLAPARRVEVINAGIPAYDLKANIERLATEILPLQPDMIISYHGYNGFGMIDTSLPPIRATKPPPAYKRRPLKLLADAEYRLKMMQYRERTLRSPRSQETGSGDPMDSEYADAYQELVQICRTNGIRLVLATYSMAVHERSDPAVIEFQHKKHPKLHWQMKANVAHAHIVRTIAKDNPEIVFVDTHPALDGDHEKFTDLVHFTPEGKREMAEIFFAAIRNVLEQELSVSSPAAAR
jgi:lysophospholipase L1-like esterase